MRERCGRRRGCGLVVMVSQVVVHVEDVVVYIPSRASRHGVVVEKRMNWRSVAGRGRPIGRRKDMKGAVAAMVSCIDWLGDTRDGRNSDASE
jgi:hypothetical protein